VRRELKPAVQAPSPAAQPKVVCGMTIVPVDPSIDARMIVPRASGGVDYTLRKIEPPICNPAK
jgi:hypothetical protein